MHIAWGIIVHTKFVLWSPSVINLIQTRPIPRKSLVQQASPLPQQGPLEAQRLCVKPMLNTALTGGSCLKEGLGDSALKQPQEVRKWGFL